MAYTKTSILSMVGSEGNPTRARGYEAMDIEEMVPSDTLKRHPKMDLNRNDLLKLLSYLEGELQARDLSIAALKAEKASQILYQAKYGQFGLGDAFFALQRDADDRQENRHDDCAVKLMYENQLGQLENLISTQRSAHLKMQGQLVSVEKRYHKVCADLDDEKRKHAQDTAQGDDVTYMLEKERERLKQELEFEKSQRRKIERELAKLQGAVEEERLLTFKHKQVSLLLIKERKQLFSHYGELKLENLRLQRILEGDVSKDTGNSHQGVNENSAAVVSQVVAVRETKVDELQKQGQWHKDETQAQQFVDDIGGIPQQIDLESLKFNAGKFCQESGSVNLLNQRNKKRVAVEDKIAVTNDTKSFSVLVKEDASNHSFLDQTVDFSCQYENSVALDSDALKKVDHNYKESFQKFSDPREVLHTSLQKTPLVENLDTLAIFPENGTRHLLEKKNSGTRMSISSGSVATCARRSGFAGRGIPPPVPPNKPQINIPSLQNNAMKVCSSGPKDSKSTYLVPKSGKDEHAITPVRTQETTVYLLKANKERNQSNCTGSQIRNSAAKIDKDVGHQSSEICLTR